MANNMVPNHSLSPADKQCLSFACRVYLCVWKLRLEADELLITGLVPFFFFKYVSSVSPPPFKELIADSSAELYWFSGLSKNYRLTDWRAKLTVGILIDCFWFKSVFFHSKRWEFNYFTFFYYSTNAQPLQYNDNKSLYKLPDVLLSGRMSITECCVSIFKTTHKTNKPTTFLW